ncbi:hypothetical protein ColLi_12691 [Colletotrichum liriopes]|uniref:Uncharacterized protein n=1 Tax=Colletotrichum liriopes TaxID=708192 RepID=A0AA37GYV2_9PEZI|nr:hypothetical protein ColLi_12691 [Colletotrichum liriopes]
MAHGNNHITLLFEQPHIHDNPAAMSGQEAHEVGFLGLGWAFAMDKTTCRLKLADDKGCCSGSTPFTTAC